MKVSKIDDVINYKNKENLIKSFLYLKLCEYEGLVIGDETVKLSDNDFNILSLFAFYESKEEVIKIALEREYVKSEQSGENVVTKLVNLGILVKTGKKKRKINKDILLPIDGDMIIFKLTMYGS